MTTTAFQYIFDNAESISINKRAVVAQTSTRDQTVRTVSRGGQVWRFDVKPPAGLPWTEARSFIELIDVADRFTTGTVQINNSGYNSWLMPYQGDSANTTGFVGSFTQGSNILTLTTSPSTPGLGYKFKAGDLIQLGSTRKVYSVAANVSGNSNTVTLNRPILESTSNNVSLIIGPSVTWNVICLEIPQWTISARNLVTFNGSFKFVESIL